MVHVAQLSPIIGDDGLSGGGDDAAPPIFAPTDFSTNAGAGVTVDPQTGVATPASDPGPTLGPVEDRNSAWVEHLASTFGVGTQAVLPDPGLSENGAAGGGGGSFFPGFSGDSPHLITSGGGATDALSSGDATETPMAGAGAIAPSSFGVGSVSAGVGSEGSGNGLAGVGGNNFFAALTGAFSSPAGQSQDIPASSLNLDSQLSQLVQAMASYSAVSPGSTPSPVTQVSNDSALLGVIAAAGHA